MQNTPYFSIIIPARDEEKNLPKCLERIKASAELSQKSYEIIVVVNRCTDRTEEIAREAGCKIAKSDAKNLSIIRNAGVKQSQGEIIVTIDADSLMSKNMLSVVYNKMQNPKIVGGGVMILPERWSLGIVLSFFMLVPLVIYYRIFCGLFFCRKVDFDAIAGFDESRSSLEDVDFAVRLKKYGKISGRNFALVFRAYIITSCRKFDKFGDWFFINNPRLMWKVLTGKHQAAADKIWYDFPRE